jgi:fatty acid desaturase
MAETGSEATTVPRASGSTVPRDAESTAYRASGFEVRWYRVPLDREKMRELARRTDGEGLLQSLGFLLLLAVTGTAAWLAWGRLPWYLVALILFVHGTFFAFLLNGFHELVHGTVFKTKALNAIFLRIYSFLSWNSHIAFRASHTRHHLNTLHPPYDLEVVLPIQLKPAGFLLAAIVDVVGIYGVIRDSILLSFGVVRGEWQLHLFPPSDKAARRPLVQWARLMLLGQALIIVVSAVTGLWQLAVIVSAARFYGGWLQWLCNNTQHVGLQDNVEDFRLCCRTVKLNPFVQFLYFHMNHHVEHHMYASIPCYHLGRLRRELLPALPPARWLIPAWVEIIGILRRQKKEPGYRYVVPLPSPAAN